MGPFESEQAAALERDLEKIADRFNVDVDLTMGFQTRSIRGPISTTNTWMGTVRSTPSRSRRFTSQSVRTSATPLTTGRPCSHSRSRRRLLSAHVMRFSTTLRHSSDGWMIPMSDDLDLEELREKTERGDRNDEDKTDSDQDFVDELVEALDAVDRGDRPKTIAVRDQPIAALLAALDESDERMADVGQALEESLGRDTSDEFDWSEIARLAFRVGFESAAPDQMEQLRDAIGKHAQQDI